VKQQIKRLEEPSLKCCQLVYDELIRILGQLLGKVVRITFFSPEVLSKKSIYQYSKPSDAFLPCESASMPSLSTSSSNQ